MVVGSPSKLIVIDIDNAEIMQKFQERLREKHPEIYEKVSKTYIVQTPKGGVHIYIRYDGLENKDLLKVERIRRNYEQVAEWKGKGYVVAPYSTHENSLSYVPYRNRSVASIKTFTERELEIIYDTLIMACAWP